MAKISIVVPVYNVKSSLRNCVDSILAQTFSDFELILVDDGSTDGSEKICDDYLKKDSRVSVLHKKNGGLSDARNEGIKRVSSEYVGFIDSDDTIELDMFEMLYKNILEHDADVSICGLFDCYIDRKVPQCSKECFGVLNGKEAIKTALEGKKFSVNAVNKLYKKNLFSSIKFPKGKLSEDAFTIPKVLANAKKVVFSTKPKYNYMHRKGTITTSEFKLNDLNVVEGYKEIFDFVVERFPDLEKQAEFRLLWSYIYVLDKMVLSSNFNYFNEYKKVLSILKKNTYKILINPFFSYKRKLMMLVLFLSKGVYSKFVKYNASKQRNLFS